MIRVSIADDQHLVRRALEALPEAEPDLDIMAKTIDGIETTQKVIEQDADVALIDIEIPRPNGIDAIAKISDHCRCLAAITFTRSGYFKRTLQAGANGFLAKNAPSEQLVEAIRRIHSDLRAIDPASAETSLFTTDPPLTSRETEIARPILQGADISTITGQPFIAKSIVRSQMSSVITKTNTSNRAETAKTARDSGWL